MTTELWMLLAATALYFVQIMAAAGPKILLKGMPWAISSREEEGMKMPAWSGRLDRAVENLKENLLLFAPVVLVVHAAGAANGTSALGAMIFVGARVAHFGCYAAGIPGLRTLSWLTGVIGTAMVASAVLI